MGDRAEVGVCFATDRADGLDMEVRREGGGASCVFGCEELEGLLRIVCACAVWCDGDCCGEAELSGKQGESGLGWGGEEEADAGR